jgi:hypothetical protein
MNGTTAFLVDAQIDELRTEAHRRRLANDAKGPGLVHRIVSGLAAALTAPTTDRDLPIPKLDGYPYRG